LMLGIGLWAWTEKDMFQNLSKLSQIPLDPALLLILAGTLIFVIGFTGCIGALRENTFLLLVVGTCSEVVHNFQCLILIFCIK